MKTTVRPYAAIAALAVLVACDVPPPIAPGTEATRASLSAGTEGPASMERSVESSVESSLEITNAALEASGAAYRAFSAEWIAAPGSSEAGKIVYAHDVGNKRVGADFVPGDGRREPYSGTLAADPTDRITFAIDQRDAVPLAGGASAAATTAAIRRAMASWSAQSCSILTLAENPTYGFDVGVVAFLTNNGGSPYTFADVQHAGFTDLDFRDAVLGVTYTFAFIDQKGAPTDIDGDGYVDVAFREIYYDKAPWAWVTTPPAGASDIDIESIALHESGHGLSQAHFGKIEVTKHNWLHISPRAVMNAAYSSPLRTLLGTDQGGHCGIWGSWPAN